MVEVCPDTTRTKCLSNQEPTYVLPAIRYIKTTDFHTKTSTGFGETWMLELTKTDPTHPESLEIIEDLTHKAVTVSQSGKRSGKKKAQSTKQYRSPCTFKNKRSRGPNLSQGGLPSVMSDHVVQDQHYYQFHDPADKTFYDAKPAD